MQIRMTLQRLNELPSRWDDIRYLLAVLRAGSFTQAAEALGTQQSTVSRRIANLEEEWGVILFERGARTALPTPVAAALRDAAEQVEAQLGRLTDLAVSRHHHAVAGRVRLALTEEMAVYFVIPQVLPDLRARYPELEVDLVTSYRSADLMAHEADIALRFHQTTRGDLVGRKVGSMESSILCASHRLESWANCGIDELPWIVVELEGGRAFETRWIEERTTRAPVLRCSSYQVQLAAIAQGLGVGIGPSAVAKWDKGFSVLESPLPFPVLDLYLLTRRSIRDLPRIAVVMDALDQGIVELLRHPSSH